MSRSWTDEKTSDIERELASLLDALDEGDYDYAISRARAIQDHAKRLETHLRETKDLRETEEEEDDE